MARAYANIVTAIWLDPEFCDLSAGAQRTYFMLVTQTDITACGTLPLTLRRWARTVPEAERPSLACWLAELEEHRYVLTDEDTEELLVRTFAKWDGGYKHAKRVLAVVATAEAIRSSRLKHSVATELASLGVEIAIPLPTGREPIANQEATGSGRSVVTVGELGPHSTLLTPEPGPAPKPLPLAPLSHPNETGHDTAQVIIGEWIERCSKRPPSRVVGQMAKLIGEMLAEGIVANDVRRGISAWMTKNLAPSILPSVVNEVMNSPARSSVNGSRPTTDSDTAFQFGVG